MSKENKIIRRNAARKEVQRRGGEILRNEHFRKCLKQKHHTVTVGEHSLGVAEDALIIADALEKIGLHADRDKLVRAGLCHDWGMLGRYEKYQSEVETCMSHPGESLKITNEIYPDLTDEEKDSILHHMFPVLPVPPHTLEGLIVCLADKKSAIREELFHRNKPAGEASKIDSDMQAKCDDLIVEAVADTLASEASKGGVNASAIGSDGLDVEVLINRAKDEILKRVAAVSSSPDKEKAHVAEDNRKE